MKRAGIFLVTAVSILVMFFVAAVNPPTALAVPSYARQTGLACSGCHYTPPELNPAGRRFKLLGYVDKADETKVIKTEGGKSRAALDLLASLPLSVMLDASFTSTKSSVPATQNGSFELPQDISLFLSGAWTTHVGSFLQVTYDTQDDNFSMDNTDIRYANTTKVRGKELVYGLDLNNNPTVEDLWNSTPAWGFPWVASDWAPTPTATPILNGALAQDVAGLGAFGMWNNHLYLDASVYRSEHVAGTQPNPGTGSAFNIRGVAPYWRLAWQELTAKDAIRVRHLWHAHAIHPQRDHWSGGLVHRLGVRYSDRPDVIQKGRALVSSHVYPGKLRLAGQPRRGRGSTGLASSQHLSYQCRIPLRQPLYGYIRLV